MAPNVESQIPSILTHSGSDTAASSPPPVLLTSSHHNHHQQRHNMHQRHHSTPLPMSLPMSLLTSQESQEQQDPPESPSYGGYQNSIPTSPMKTASSFQPAQPPGSAGSPNRMLSRLFSKSFFDDFQTALKQYDQQYAPAGGSSDLLTVAGHDRRTHHQPSYLPSMLHQHHHHHLHQQHVPRAGNVSRSNSSSVGSVRSMALVPTRTPSPLDFRTMSFRRPRSLASEESGGKQSTTRTDSGYEKY
uniref:Uncharacterized protein n=1 Tax=Anopheles maculatus TaxID=74869 RepID=A0A182SUF5_9DIPT